MYPRRFTEDIFFDAAEAFEVLDEEEPETGIYARRLRLSRSETGART